MSKVLNKRRISFFSPGKYSVLYIREKRGGRGSKEITLLGSRGGGVGLNNATWISGEHFLLSSWK